MSSMITARLARTYVALAMSASGQDRTFAVPVGMSAKGLKADVIASPRNVRC